MLNVCSLFIYAVHCTEPVLYDLFICTYVKYVHWCIGATNGACVL